MLNQGPFPDRRPLRVFVVGCDAFSMRMLQTVDWGTNIEFVPLLGIEEVRPSDHGPPDFIELTSTAMSRLETDGSHVDAVVGWWDFPTTGLVPVLRESMGLPGANLRSVATLEHKYWSRIDQSEIIPELIPRFAAIDPFTTEAAEIDFPFPFWIKPVKSHSSHLGFKVENVQELERVLDLMREGIAAFGVPFDQFLSLIELPDSVRQVTGHHCLIEEIISSGRQCTLEGYACAGEVKVYGVVDSIRSGIHRSCFSRYQYPSSLPESVEKRMIDATRKVISHAGYDASPFNAEFFWNPDTNEIKLLEVNTRISKSHCPLFWMVDGESHQEVLVDLALGLRPRPASRAGRHEVAAKFMIRAYEDAIVERMPDAGDVRRLQQTFPDLRFKPLVEEEARLAHLPYQDSYSFELAELYIGAPDEETLLDRYEQVMERLPLYYRAWPPEAA